MEIPDLRISSALEALPDHGADGTVFVEHGAGIVELVGCRDELDVPGFCFETLDVGHFTLFPAFLLVRVLGKAVRESLHHPGHFWTEIALDVFQPGHSAVILDGIV